MTDHDSLQDLTPTTVHDAMIARQILLVDVREPGEYLAERIPGAVLFPLSTFDPEALPSPDICKIVFHCQGGLRSARAIDKCLALGIPHAEHLAGGLNAWRAIGLPTISSPSTRGAP
jgi:rhodanese-related sulfurtransferase